MEVGLILGCGPSLRNKALYVLRTLLFTMGIRFREIEDLTDLEEGIPIIYYGLPETWNRLLKTCPNPVLAIFANVETERYFKVPEPYPLARVKTFSGGIFKEIPILFYTPFFAFTGKWFEENGPQTLCLHVDLIASAFYFLSCWQEYTNQKRDNFDRFPFAESIQSKLSLATRPVVNEYLQLIQNLLKKVAESKGRSLRGKPGWPKGKSFAICLTHDIDTVQKWRWNTFHREFKVLAKNILQKRGKESWRRAKKLLSYLIKKQDPYWVYDHLIEGEALRNCSSSFYFLGGRSDNSYDIGYSLARKKVKKLLAKMAQKGVEVGLHGSFNTYKDSKILAEETQRLAAMVGKVTGTRQHYLRLDMQETFSHMEGAGLQYDTTLGFAESPGFRASFAYPFFPYDIIRDRPHEILEIPLVVMDATLRSYQGLDTAASAGTLKQNMGVLASYEGCGALLWHNGYFDEIDFPGYGELYWQALDWISANGGWGASGREINDWWRARLNY